MSGMRRFSDLEIVRLAMVQQGAMQDTGRIWHAVETKGADGGLSTALVAGPVVECGVYMMSGTNSRRLEYVDPRFDARLRLPSGTDIKPNDRFEVLTRFGTALSTPLMFRVDGPAMQGPSGMTCDLVRDEARRDAEW
jgi:hypothetical protein